MGLRNKKIYYGWLIVAASSGIGFANAATAIGILTIFVTPMSQEFGWTRTELAGATSLGALLGAALAPLSGRIVDKLGSRVLLTLGGLTVALSCSYLALAQTLIGFYVAFTFARIADQGLIKIGTAPAVGKWFSKFRGRATGIIFFSESAGMTIMAPVVQLVIMNYGWRTAWLMLGGGMLIFGAIPCAWLIRRQPEDMGLLPDGIQLSSKTKNGAVCTVENAPSDNYDTPFNFILKSRGFWLIIVSLFLVSSGMSGIGLHLVPHLIQQGLEPMKAVGTISIMSITGASGALFLGFLSERLSPRYLLAGVYLLGAASIMVLINTDSLSGTYTFAVLHGITGSGVNLLTPLLWAHVYGRNSLGSIFGISRAAQVAGFAVGPLISGIVYDNTDSYQPAFWYFASLAVLSTCLILMARPTRPTNTV